MTLDETGGINVTRPHIDMVRQPDNYTCFAACVSTLTGIPLYALPLHAKAALDTVLLDYNTFIIATDKVREYVKRDLTTLEDWQKGIDNIAILEGWTHWDTMLGAGILCLVLHKPDGWDGHAVVIDEQGFLHDPADGAFEGISIMSLTRACNVTVSGFISFTEVES